ncbi:MAG: histidine--tRNA ligase [Bdellovibrionota bacterium]
MAKNKGISGFPEWLPAEKKLEDTIIELIKGIYESHGFTPIETPAVELLETLSSKGEIDKEIYAVKRLAAANDDEAELGLHFDLTVPFARYVAMYFNDLIFPFKRYQLQKVWRGERPQKGRFREFYQFDIDIVSRDELPLCADAEVVTVLAKALVALRVGTPRVELNNRKLLLGYFSGLGVSDEIAKQVVSIVDKIDKIGEPEAARLIDELSLAASTRDKILEFAATTAPVHELDATLKKFSLDSSLAEEGAEELLTVASLIPKSMQEHVVVRFQIARGLDYYTGTIVESKIAEFPEFGSVGSGGRYQDLVSKYLSRKVPGVGISIGLTRLMDLILREQLLPLPRLSSAQILVTVLNEEVRREATEFAEELREEGLSCEVFFRSPKLGKQIEYADKKGIPFVVFLDSEKSVKNIETGEQVTFSDIPSLKNIVLASNS